MNYKIWLEGEYDSEFADKTIALKEAQVAADARRCPAEVWEYWDDGDENLVDTVMPRETR